MSLFALHHTCFVVRDVVAAAERLSATIGLGPWHVWTITPEWATLRGRPVSMSFRVALAEHGGSNYELITPLSGESLASEHLTTHGEGFHHTCHTFTRIEDLRAVKQQYLDRGVELLQDAGLGELGEFCYFAVPETASIVELLFLNGLPPPEMSITA